MSTPKVASLELNSSSPDETFELGRRLGASLRAGDVVLLVGALGAGKTSFTRGVGEGLGVHGQVTSPTFVLARVHPSTSNGPALVHVDAYRLSSEAELEDLDIDAFADTAVTIVEWGDGIGAGLSDSRLRIELARDGSWNREQDRVVVVSSVGPRWDGVPLGGLFEAEAQ